MPIVSLSEKSSPGPGAAYFYFMTMYHAHAHISAQKTFNYHLYSSLSLERSLYVTFDDYDILISFHLCC